MSSFQDLGVVRLQLRRVDVEQALSVELQDRERACSAPTARNSVEHLKKTISSVLSVILINL